MNPKTSARIRVSGLILRSEHAALVEFNSATYGVHFNLPGGGLDPGETLRDGVKRECKEEIDCLYLRCHRQRLERMWLSGSSNGRNP